MKKEDTHSTHWELMVETAKEVAALKDGSHERLKAEFLEEFGQLPTSDLLDYYDDLLKNDIDKTKLNPKKSSRKASRRHRKTSTNPQAPTPDPDLVETNQDPQESGPDIENPIEKGTANEAAVSEMAFAEKMASEKQLTVLGFRKSFEATFGEEPSLELVAHFLKRLAYCKRETKAVTETPDKGKSAQNNFIPKFINTGSPTVLTFRRAFEKEFGEFPSTEMVTRFLNELSRKKFSR